MSDTTQRLRIILSYYSWCIGLFCMVCFRRRVRIAGGRFWCAVCYSVNRTYSTSTLFYASDIEIRHAVTWLATGSGWARSKRSAICSGKLCGGIIIFGQCCPCGYLGQEGRQPTDRCDGKRSDCSFAWFCKTGWNTSQMKTVSWCFRTLSSYIAYLSIIALTLPLTLTLTLLTLTPPLHKFDECTKLLFRAVRTFRGLGRGVYRILYWRGKLGDQNSGDCFSHYRLKRYEKCSLK